jgi:uncharacterized protein YjiS (DUF1127 family)
MLKELEDHRVTETRAEARRMAQAYDELAAMSDPELRDIGINRSDILAVVSGAYRHEF